ncbi:MAG TPA: PLP-dependent aspartate aminotransferase family protein, partial [Noviherbaspirillum sp.]|nr:PLP-dependent aspartate aminotransferase family protein [Noviherbaspirillum sp.]
YDGVVFESPRYGRTGTGTTFELQTAMAALENTESCIATASGLSAIAAVLLSHAVPGRQILVFEGVYGRTRTLCEKELNRLGVKVRFFSSEAELRERLEAPTTLVYVEVPASLTMQMLDVEAVCHDAHAAGVPVACDSTWGTPAFFHPHALGVDISIHSATKYINGHSDLMLGLITGTYEALEPARTWCDRYGSHVAPDVCWLALRGLRTLGVRMQRHQENAVAVATWLRGQERVKAVYFPVLPEDRGHALWKKQFSGGGGPFSFEFEACDEAAFSRFIDNLQLFGLGTSWGGVDSLVMPAIPHHLRALPVQPDEGRLVRLHIGLADPQDLCADLQQAFEQM